MMSHRARFRELGTLVMHVLRESSLEEEVAMCEEAITAFADACGLIKRGYGLAGMWSRPDNDGTRVFDVIA